MGKPLIAVITAVAGGFAEQELLHGIIAENQRNGYATVVLSNIYNIVQENADLQCEQRIYELVYSPEICGVILFCESFVETRARRMVASLLAGLKVPLIGIGTMLPEFATLNMLCLNTDDVQEMEALTDHLIEVHGFKNIMMLTGMPEIQASHQRVEGYRRSLRKHGIPEDPKKIIFGDFWTTSGVELADRFISGELALPEAILCGNDRMAYGLLGRFSEAKIKVPQQVTVISYEYSDLRLFFSPPLTCLRRDREALGKAAAERLHVLLSGAKLPEFIPPRGTMIYGASCSCPINEEQSLIEQREAAVRRNYNDLNLFSTMEYRMTLCRDMEEFTRIIGDHQWMIRDKRSMYLRLFADWYDQNAPAEGLMQSRCIIPWQDTSIFENDRLDLRILFDREPDAAVCYYTPVFTGNKLFGDMAVLYDAPAGYDDVFRHWLKSVSIGLEFLRLKNDIRYLLSCQSVSEYRDTLTGLYNDKGLKRAFLAQTVHDGRGMCCIMLKICLFPHPVSEADIAARTEAVAGAGKAVSRFCSNHDVAGRISDDTFVCFAQSRAEASQLADLLSVILMREKGYMDYAGMDSFACAAVPCGEASYEEMLEHCAAQTAEIRQMFAERRRKRLYAELLELRNLIYAAPEITFEQDNELLPEDRMELYRVSYKKCFGSSFHQDCIAARVAKAKYYLATTQLELSEISEKCGYVDHKYFQRQFAAVTGIPAMQYRSLIKG